jgi:hypothetical protein
VASQAAKRIGFATQVVLAGVNPMPSAPVSNIPNPDVPEHDPRLQNASNGKQAAYNTALGSKGSKGYLTNHVPGLLLSISVGIPLKTEGEYQKL